MFLRMQSPEKRREKANPVRKDMAALSFHLQILIMRKLIFANEGWKAEGTEHGIMRRSI